MTIVWCITDCGVFAYASMLIGVGSGQYYMPLPKAQKYMEIALVINCIGYKDSFDIITTIFVLIIRKHTPGILTLDCFGC